MPSGDYNHGRHDEQQKWIKACEEFEVGHAQKILDIMQLQAIKENPVRERWRHIRNKLTQNNRS